MFTTGGLKKPSDGDQNFKDHHGESRLIGRRIIISFVIVICVFLGLLARYYSLQIIHYENYATQSDRNRIQVRPITPNRGLIFDAKGALLAEHRPIMTLSIIKERAGDIDHLIAQLRDVIEITDRDVERFYKALSTRRRPYEPVPLRFKLSEEELAKISVEEYIFEGIEIEAQLVRYYPYDDLLAHVVGYVGRVDIEELSAFTPEEQSRYSGTQSIGKIGLEKFYEAQLLGYPGEENIETNARGRVLRVLERHDPVAGHDLSLFLDVELQQAAVEALGDYKGAIVAIDVETGGVLSLVSNPGYDPNLFVTGISNKNYQELRTSKDLPLLNRAIQGQYPPGSTVKPMLGLAGLEYNFITEQSHVRDPGFYQLENDKRIYRDWKRGGHGQSVDLYEAIAESCDVFFYDLGFRMGVDRMHTFGLHFGLGSRSKLDIPSERSGLWPSRKWKKRARGLSWYPGNSLNMSIGQGDVLTTPVQLAVMASVLANRGVLIEPRLVKEIGGIATKKVVRSIYIGKDSNWDLILQSMVGVLHSAHGTARSIARNMTFKMAGKTGTAQVVSIAQDGEYDSEALTERNRDHALFVGFAPAEDPKIAFAVVIENGEKSSRAATISRKIAEKYLTIRAAQEQKTRKK